MATYYSNAGRGYRLTYIVDEVSTSTAKNSSQVRFRLYLTTGSNSYAQYTFGGSVWVNGQYTFTAPSALGFNSNHLLIDRTIEIPHDSNGNKTVTVSARLNGPGGYAPGMLSISDKKFELTKIARASSVKSTDGYFGDTLAITITRSDASFTHDVTYTFEGLSGTVANDVGTSTTLSTQLGWMSKIPNVKSGNGKIIIATKSGSTVIGTSETPFTLTVPDTIKPKLTGLTFTDTNTKVPPVVGANTFVQIVSNPSVTFNGAVGAYGSTIETYTAKILDKDQVVYSNGGTFGILQWFGKVTVEATVTDSRGQVSDPFRTTMNVIEYKGVSLDFKVDRGAVNANQLVVTVTASVSPLLVGGVQKNKMILSFKTAPSGTQTFTIDISSASSTYTNKYELPSQQFILSGTFDNAKSFDVYGTITDAFGVADSKKVPVSSQFKALTLMDNGSPTNSGVGVNKKWEKGAVDAIGDIHATGKYYSGGKEIQHYQLTDNAGKLSSLDNIDLNTVINDSKPIAIYATANTPIAGHGYYYLEVFQHTLGNSYVMQRATTRAFSGGVRVFERIRENNIWGNWIELLTANSPTMTTTDWTFCGANGASSYYKQVGNMISLRFRHAKAPGGNVGIANLPDSIMPGLNAPYSYSFIASSFETVPEIRNVQFNPNDTNLTLLNSTAGKVYSGLWTWLI